MHAIARYLGIVVTFLGLLTLLGFYAGITIWLAMTIQASEMIAWGVCVSALVIMAVHQATHLMNYLYNHQKPTV